MTAATEPWCAYERINTTTLCLQAYIYLHVCSTQRKATGVAYSSWAYCTQTDPGFAGGVCLGVGVTKMRPPDWWFSHASYSVLAVDYASVINANIVLCCRRFAACNPGKINKIGRNGAKLRRTLKWYSCKRGGLVAGAGHPRSGLGVVYWWWHEVMMVASPALKSSWSA